MRRNLILASALLTMVVAPVAANKEEETVKTQLVGYQETPLTINSPGTGEFKAKVRQEGTAIDYELTYRDLSSAVTQSHIHFGRPAITGGIVLFLCTNLTPPANVPTPQACPAAPASITGTLTSADVIAVPAQGIEPGSAGLQRLSEPARPVAQPIDGFKDALPRGVANALVAAVEDQGNGGQGGPAFFGYVLDAERLALGHWLSSVDSCIPGIT